MSLSPQPDERAVYVVEGRVSIDGELAEAGQLAVLAARGTVELAAQRIGRIEGETGFIALPER